MAPPANPNDTAITPAGEIRPNDAPTVPPKAMEFSTNINAKIILNEATLPA